MHRLRSWDFQTRFSRLISPLRQRVKLTDHGRLTKATDGMNS